MSSADGYFWVGGQTVATEHGTVLKGQMFVQHLRPAARSGVPFILIHGGGGQGLDYLATPDGRPGWAPLLAERGHDVYVVDRVGHGRSPYDPAQLGGLSPAMGAEFLGGLFFPPADGPGSHPTAALHTQWPGGRTVSDEVVRQLLASQGPMLADAETAQRLDQAALTALLDQAGPAVLVSHSAGGPAGFLAADARPGRVLALVACEPLGPPFLGAPGLPLPWGLTSAPVTYDPPAAGPDELAVTVDESAGPIPRALQQEPARRLAALAEVPIVLVTAEASPFRWFEDHTRAFLEQAGCAVDAVRLWEHGIAGNAHGFPLELNNADILDLLLARVEAVQRGGTRITAAPGA